MDRISQQTKQPDVLSELFEALGNDPFVIAECLARPVLAERSLGSSIAHKQNEQTSQVYKQTMTDTAQYILPSISDAATGCTPDTWTATSTINAPSARVRQTSVWTGSEMIIWGGWNGPALNTGGRYDPTTDSWTATSTANAPAARLTQAGVWTGTEMIVWGGFTSNYSNTGGRYNPLTDTWTATSTTNAPAARGYHTAVWTGSEMIIWGGYTGVSPFFVTTEGR